MTYILKRSKNEYITLSEFDGMPEISNVFYEFETKKQAKEVLNTINAILSITDKKPFELYSLTKEAIKKASSTHEVEIED